MRKVFLKLKDSDVEVCKNAMIAESLLERMLGLMFKKELEPNSGLLIIPCYQIHTFFMRMAIDVAFMDKNLKILKIYRNLVPWRMTGFFWKSLSVLEMKAGSMPLELKEGDQLEEACTN